MKPDFFFLKKNSQLFKIVVNCKMHVEIFLFCLKIDHPLIYKYQSVFVVIPINVQLWMFAVLMFEKDILIFILVNLFPILTFKKYYSKFKKKKILYQTWPHCPVCYFLKLFFNICLSVCKYVPLTRAVFLCIRQNLCRYSIFFIAQGGIRHV